MFTTTRHSRNAFTMVELLTVVAVITLMTALLVGASFRFVAGARESATTATITKANGIIQDRVRAFHEFDFSDASISFNNSYGLGNQVLAEVFVRKLRYKKAFPQAFAELDTSQIKRFFPSISGPLPASLPSTYDPKYESGIVLFALLAKGETFGAATPADDTFAGAEVKSSPETGGLQCLVDGWGQPIRFYRWPTRLIRCGEWNFSGINAFDDYNQNSSTVPDPAGWVDTISGTTVTSTFSPAIRPNLNLPIATPASLLISTLPRFDPPPAGTNYAFGADGIFGTAGGAPPFNYLGAPDTDDPESLNIDPDDPSFQLSTWCFNGNIASNILAQRRFNFVYGSTLVNGIYVDAFHDFYTFHTPLIVSAGSDRQLGLYEPSDIPTAVNRQSMNCGYLAAPILAATGPQNLQALYDNITNLNQRAGGK